MGRKLVSPETKRRIRGSLSVPSAKVQSLARGKKVIDLPVVCGSSGAEVVTVRMIPGDQYNFVPSGNGQGLKREEHSYFTLQRR